MRIMLDTNILISALVFGGAVRSQVRKLFQHGDILCVSEYILEEFDEVAAEKWPEKAAELKEIVRHAGFVLVDRAEETSDELRDAKDNPVLADARASGIDAILTQDKDFLESGIETPSIYSVSKMWEYLNQ